MDRAIREQLSDEYGGRVSSDVPGSAGVNENQFLLDSLPEVPRLYGSSRELMRAANASRPQFE